MKSDNTTRSQDVASGQGTDKRVALITGANKGIGFEIARQLAKKHVTVLLGTRDPARGEAAANTLRSEGLDARFVQLDVTDIASVQHAAATIGGWYGQFDILVNNAGINDAADGPPGSADIDAAKRVFDTNFFGPLAVTQAMLPLLRQAPAARIVNMSSTLGSLASNSDPASPYYGVRPIAYNASKAALNMLTVTLAEELREAGIAVNAVCPGYVSTDLNGHTGNLSPQDAAATPVRLALLTDASVTGRFISAEGDVPW